jgi:hypothetical protein
MNTSFWFDIGAGAIALIAGIATGFYYLVNKGKMKMLLKEKTHSVKLPDNCFWQTHTRLHETLTELRVRTDCARAQIVQFHNGGEFLDGISMKKMSLTHESLDKGVSSELSNKQDILLSLCIGGLNLLLKDNPIMHIVEDMEDSWCKQFYQSSNIIAFAFLPIKKNGQAIGYVMVQWCSWAKADTVEDEIISKELEDARALIEVQLDILKDKHGKKNKRNLHNL